MHIQTARLRLVALPLEQLELLLNAPDELEKRLGLPISRANLQHPVPRALRMKIERMRAEDPANHPWSTYWLLITPAPDFGAGLVGFKGAPDAEGSVEIGYGIDPLLRGKGYMTEAVSVLVAWAFAHPGCRAVTACGVLNENLASQQVLIKAGFTLAAQNAHTSDWKITRPGEPV